MPTPEEPETNELRELLRGREAAESTYADSPEENEAAQHQRRAEKAAYLREKLEERAASEREGPDSEE